jgi:hypothetical protein
MYCSRTAAPGCPWLDVPTFKELGLEPQLYGLLRILGPRACHGCSGQGQCRDPQGWKYPARKRIEDTGSVVPTRREHLRSKMKRGIMVYRKVLKRPG